MKMPELPPMDVGMAGQVKFAYSEEALRAYGEAVREACAKEIAEVAEALHGEVSYMSSGSPISEADCWMLEQAEKLDEIAASIRQEG